MLLCCAAAAFFTLVFIADRVSDEWEFIISAHVLLLAEAGAACVALTFVFQYRAAQRAAGAGYAIGHLAFAIALTPLLLLGVVVVPLLVQSELQRGGMIGRLGR